MENISVVVGLPLLPRLCFLYFLSSPRCLICTWGRWCAHYRVSCRWFWDCLIRVISFAEEVWVRKSVFVLKVVLHLAKLRKPFGYFVSNPSSSFTGLYANQFNAYLKADR